jgi:WD40 repeat protein
MKKNIATLFLLAFSMLSFAQSSLDSLRLVLPIGHTEGIKDFTISRNEQYCASLGVNQEIILWNISQRKEIKRLEFSELEINQIEFSADNEKIILFANKENCENLCGHIVLFDLKSEETLRKYEKLSLDDSEKFVFTSSKNELLFIDTANNVTLIDLNNGNIKLQIKPSGSKLINLKQSISGDSIITMNENNELNIWNRVDGRLLISKKVSSYGIDLMKISNDGRRILFLNTKGEISYFEFKSGVFGVVKIKNNTPSQNIIDLDYLMNEYVLINYDNSSIHLYSTLKNKVIKKFWTEGNQIIKIHVLYESKICIVTRDLIYYWDIFSTTKPINFTGNSLYDWSHSEISQNCNFIITSSEDSDNSNLTIWNLKSMKDNDRMLGRLSVINNWKIFSTNNYILYQTLSQDESANMGPMRKINKKNTLIKIFDPKTSSYIKEIKWESVIENLKFNSNDSSLIISNSLYENDYNLYKFDFKKDDIDTLKGHRFKISDFSFYEDKIISSSWDSTIIIWNAENKEITKVLGKQNNYVDDLIINEDILYSICRDNTIILWDLIEKKKINLIKLNSEFLSLSINQEQSLCSYFEKKIIYILDAKTGNKLDSILNYESEIIFSNFVPTQQNKMLVMSADNSISLIDVISKHIIYSFYHEIGFIQNSIILSQDGQYFVVIKDDKVFLYKLSTGTLIKEFVNSNQASFNAASNLLFIKHDSHFEFFHTIEQRSISNLYQLENNNYLVKLPNSPYYMCSKDASKMLHYVTPSLKVIGFEQLDPVYNRPDIVLDSIGKYFGGADQELVANYRQSWKKRIDRLGLDKELLGKGEIAVPSAEIINADVKTDKAPMIEYTNSSGKTIIHVKATDSKYKLKRYNVYVNEVPVYGSLGRSITHLNTSSWEGLDSITLSNGENKIQVSVMNELGLENFKYPSYVNYTPLEPIVAKTYYIGIGVNEFKEPGHKLNYCVKDVTDLSMSFGGPNTEVKLFTNAQVTKENILALKDYLSKTTVNDKVIISCSSHGLLDDSLNFYLAMHDVDFNNPKVRGLKYEELENLLDGIPARQKLLLLDACNSGENDKTEVFKNELANNHNNMDSTQILAARGVIIKLEDENKSNFKKMNELFVNVRNNTGSVIISAAGGQESALEAITVDRISIENGAFSYCVLEYLKNNSNKPEELTVNKLKNYVEKRVEEITNGKQQPTSRQETMEVDWRLK